MAFRKMQCPKCKGHDTKYLDKVGRVSVAGTHSEKVYWCNKCGKTFNLPYELPYGSRGR